MPGAVFRLGNLPRLANSSVHSGEDIILNGSISAPYKAPE